MNISLYTITYLKRRLLWDHDNSNLNAVVQVHVKRSVVKEEVLSGEEGEPSEFGRPFRPLIRKSKLVVVDLAGSERIHKSGMFSLQGM